MCRSVILSAEVFLHFSLPLNYRKLLLGCPWENEVVYTEGILSGSSSQRASQLWYEEYDRMTQRTQTQKCTTSLTPQSSLYALGMVILVILSSTNNEKCPRTFCGSSSSNLLQIWWNWLDVDAIKTLYHRTTPNTFCDFAIFSVLESRSTWYQDMHLFSLHASKNSTIV